MKKIIEKFVWTDIKSRDDEVIRQYKSGRGSVLIARSLGIGKRTVFRILDKHSISTDVSRKTSNFRNDLDMVVISKLYNDGMNLSEIGNKFNVDAETIRLRLKSRGVLRRKPWQSLSAVPISMQIMLLNWYVDDDQSTYDISCRLKSIYNIDVHPNCVQHLINNHRVMRTGKSLREHIARKQKNKNYRTKPEEFVENILIELGKSYDWQYPIDGWTFDFKVGSMLIEVQGDYWHSLPQRRQRDAYKYKLAMKNNLRVCYIWEHEIKSNPQLVKDRISHLFLRPQFDFKQCQVRLVDSTENFLMAHHYQGCGRTGTTTVGAFLDKELIAVCVFASVTRLEMAKKQNINHDKIRELSRLCIHPGYQARNFATWFLAKARRLLKENEPNIELLISFTDPNFGHCGTIYKADNWVFDGETSPSYWYVDSKSRIIHKKTIWDRAKKNNISETELVNQLKLIKVMARPKLRFIKSFS